MKFFKKRWECKYSFNIIALKARWLHLSVSQHFCARGPSVEKSDVPLFLLIDYVSRAVRVELKSILFLYLFLELQRVVIRPPMCCLVFFNHELSWFFSKFKKAHKNCPFRWIHTLAQSSQYSEIHGLTTNFIYGLYCRLIHNTTVRLTVSL